MSDSDLSDHAYFLAIEETFLGLRGAPLTLSPSDWKVAQAWHREGIPLDLVRRTLAEIFTAREEKGVESRVSSLRYCRRAVESAWKQEQSLLATGDRISAEPVSLQARLDALAAAIPEEFSGHAEWRTEIRSIAIDDQAEKVEKALAALEDRLYERLPETIDSALLTEIDAELGRSLGALAERLPAEELDKARDRLRRQLLRRRLSLPVLSLFSPEATPDAG